MCARVWHQHNYEAGHNKICLAQALIVHQCEREIRQPRSPGYAPTSYAPQPKESAGSARPHEPLAIGVRLWPGVKPVCGCKAAALQRCLTNLHAKAGLSPRLTLTWLAAIRDRMGRSDGVKPAAPHRSNSHMACANTDVHRGLYWITGKVHPSSWAAGYRFHPS
jgi:hypothetical protein